jgi:ADP-heptose:LPS heptosyltransferase
MKKYGTIHDALFISMGGIGNCILLTPAIRAFEGIAPSARLHFLVPKNGSRQVVERHPRIGSIFEIDLSIGGLLPLIRQLRRIRPEIVMAANGTNPLKSGLIGLLGGGRIRLGESFGAGRVLYNRTVPYNPALHECTANLRMIDALSPIDTTPDPMVWTTEEDRSAAERFIVKHRLDCRWVGLHLGSGPAMAYKRWPTDRFIEVARQCIERYNCKIVVFGGPDEIALSNRAVVQIGENAVSAVGKLTLRQSYEVMKDAALFISNDSGPMHLAAVAGIPVIAIFGPTMDHKTSPLGGRTEVITAPVECRPCYNYKPITCSSFECLDRITVDQILTAVKKILVT